MSSNTRQNILKISKTLRLWIINYTILTMQPRFHEIHTMKIIDETLDYIIAPAKRYKISDKLVVHQDVRDTIWDQLIINNHKTDPTIVAMAVKQTIIQSKFDYYNGRKDKQGKIRWNQLNRDDTFEPPSYNN